MHAIKLLGQQLGKIWNQLGMNQRVTIVISGLAVLVGLSALVLWSSRPSYSLLYGRLDPTEAGNIIAELEEQNIPTRLGSGGSSIYVPQSFVHKARMQLATKGLPKESGIGFEIFDKPAFGMSDFIQQANYLRAVQGELARTISQIDGIESTRVMIVKPESRLLVDPDKKTTASVFIKLRSAGAIDSGAVNAIRFLVANSVEGLKASGVTVVDNGGNVLSESGEEGSLFSMSTSQFAARQRIEKYLERKIQNLLEGFLGPDSVAVSVAAELNNETITKTDEVYAPDPVISSLTETEETTTSESPQPSGVPGTPINTLTDTNATAFATVNNQTTSNDTTTEYAVSLSKTNLVRTAGNIKRLSASVFINSSADTNVTASLDTTKLKEAVINALGKEIPVGQDVVDVGDVTLQMIPFSKRHSDKVEMEIEQDEKKELMWNVGRSALYVVLGLAALIGFWRLVKNSSEELLPTGIPVGQLIGGQLVFEAPQGSPGMGGMGMSMGMSSGVVQAQDQRGVDDIMPEDEDVEDMAAAKSKMVMDFGLGQQAPERITIEVLKQLIRENPAKMSQAARTWMARKSGDGDNNI